MEGQRKHLHTNDGNVDLTGSRHFGQRANYVFGFLVVMMDWKMELFQDHVGF
jgi:hypothetical protein